MNFQNAKLEAMAVEKHQYPEESLPEIAVAGRSNVGKSTFINRYLNRKKLAYTSSSPGKTRTVNFYNIDQTFRLVDLPGYGYAKAAKQEQMAWARSIDQYLHSRENLREVILLLDLRHEPTALDVQMYEWIVKSGFSGYIIGTKLDKIPRTKLPQHVGMIQKKLHLPDKDMIFPYSGLDKEGMEQIRALFIIS